MKQFTKRAQTQVTDWATGGGSSGILGPAQDGLGFGGGSQGLPNEMNIPSGHTGDPGAHWSGNLVNNEPFSKKITDMSVRELTTEDLIREIKALLKINTRESLQLAHFLQEQLRERMRHLIASRQELSMLKIAQATPKMTPEEVSRSISRPIPEKSDEEIIRDLGLNIPERVEDFVMEVTNRLEEMENKEYLLTHIEDAWKEHVDSLIDSVKRGWPKRAVELAQQFMSREDVHQAAVKVAIEKFESMGMHPGLLELAQQVKLLQQKIDTPGAVTVKKIHSLRVRLNQIKKTRLTQSDHFLISTISYRLDTLQEDIEMRTSVIGSILTKASIDDWPKIIPDLEKKYGLEKVDSFFKSHLWHSGIEPTLMKYATDLKPQDISRSDFYNFYALELLLLRQIHNAPPAIEKLAVDVVNTFARGVRRGVRWGLTYHMLITIIGRPLLWSSLAKIYGPMSQMLEKLHSYKYPAKDLSIISHMIVSANPDWFGVWSPISDELVKLEEMLPVDINNIREVVEQADRLVGYAHNRGKIGEQWLPIEGMEDSGELVDFLNDKRNKWDEDFFKTQTPQIYNIYQRMKQYARIRGFSKYSEADMNTIVASIELQSLKFSPIEQKIVDKVREASNALDINIYLVGGFIRDRVSGRRTKEVAGDLDFMCEHDADKVVKYLQDKYKLPEPIRYSRSQAIMLTIDDHPADFIDAKHIYKPLRPKDYTIEEEEDETIAFDDAFRRDLTVNALMYDVRNGKLMDPTGRGLKDLKNEELNTIIDPFIKFRIHAPDMLRALRFAATLGFKLGPKMLEAMRANAARIIPRDKGGDISNRRIRKELRKAIDDPKHWAKMRELLQQAGLDIILADDIQDVQEDFEGGIDYQLDEKKSGDIMNFTKNAEERYHFDPVREGSKTLSVVLAGKVVGWVFFDPKINGWRYSPLMSDYSYGNFPDADAAARELLSKRKANLRGFVKTSGVLDWFKKDREDKEVLDILKRDEDIIKRKTERMRKSPPGVGGVRPGSQQEKIFYLAQKLDAALLKVPAIQHSNFVDQFLGQYKIIKRDPQYSEVLSLLKNYKSVAAPTKQHPEDPKEIEWRE